jgi:hypothetical protein
VTSVPKLIFAGKEVSENAFFYGKDFFLHGNELLEETDPLYRFLRNLGK